MTMHTLAVISALLVVSSIGNTCTAAKTRMVVVDKGTTTAHHVELGEDITDYNVTSYNVTALEEMIDVDYDYVDDRLYILSGWIDPKIMSVFVNGTDQRIVATLDQDSYTVAIDPYKKIVFSSLLRNGIENKPSRIISLAIDGTNETTWANRTYEASHLGVDSKNKALYWSEYGLCSCLYKMPYSGKVEDTVVETVRSDMYMKKSPHAIDYKHKLLYGNGHRGLYKHSFDSANEERISTRVNGHADTETVYDPKTERLFIVNKSQSSNVFVYTTSGTRLGEIAWLNLTTDQRKFVRINPL